MAEIKAKKQRVIQVTIAIFGLAAVLVDGNPRY
jgi:hypothetical protein